MKNELIIEASDCIYRVVGTHHMRLRSPSRQSLCDQKKTERTHPVAHYFAVRGKKVTYVGIYIYNTCGAQLQFLQTTGTLFNVTQHEYTISHR